MCFILSLLAWCSTLCIIDYIKIVRPGVIEEVRRWLPYIEVLISYVSKFCVSCLVWLPIVHFAKVGQYSRVKCLTVLEWMCWCNRPETMEFACISSIASLRQYLALNHISRYISFCSGYYATYVLEQSSTGILSSSVIGSSVYSSLTQSCFVEVWNCLGAFG